MLTDGLLAASLAVNLLVLLLLIGGRLAVRIAALVRAGLDDVRERMGEALRAEAEVKRWFRSVGGSCRH